MIEEAAISLIDKAGVAAAAFVMMYALYVQNQKWQQKNQEKNDARFDKILNNFIASVNYIASSQVAALEKLAAKLDEHTKSKEEFIELIKEERRASE